MENGRKNGVQGLRIVERAELRRMEPHISPKAACALHCPHTGITSPYEYAIALAENAIENGIVFRLQSKVVGVDLNSSNNGKTKSHSFVVHVEDLRDPNERKQAAASYSVRTRLLINCAGLYSDQAAAIVGANDFRIKPRKGTK